MNGGGGSREEDLAVRIKGREFLLNNVLRVLRDTEAVRAQAISLIYAATVGRLWRRLARTHTNVRMYYSSLR